MPPRKSKKDKTQAELARQSIPMGALSVEAMEQNSVFDFSSLVAEMANYKVDLHGQQYGSLMVPWELLRGSDDQFNQLQIRPVHEAHKEALLASFKQGVMSHTNFLARMMPKEVGKVERDRIKETYGSAFVCTANSIYLFHVFDGNHRYHTGLELIRIGWPGWNIGTRIGVIPYLHTTPDERCISYAKRINEIQHLARGASYVDNLTFVYAHVGKQILALQSTEEYSRLTVRQKREAVSEMRTRSSDLLRANLTQTFQAAQGVAGLNTAEIGNATDKFTNANVGHMLKMVTWLGAYGLKFLASMQNVRWDKLAAGRIDRPWKVNAAAMEKEGAGWPIAVRVSGCLNRWLDSENLKMSYEDSDATRRNTVAYF